MNKCTFMGRLTKDVECKVTPSGTAVANFTLAVNRKFKQDGQPEADFVNFVAWSKTAEFISKYFVKGQQVLVCGRLQNRTWDDTDGNKHYATEIVVEDTYFADSKKGNNNNGDNLDVPPTDSQDDDDLPFN